MNRNCAKKTIAAAEDKGLLDFMRKLAQATGQFESVIIQECHDENWTDVVGYQKVMMHESVLSSRLASRVSDRKEFTIALTQSGEHWVNHNQVYKGVVSYSNVYPAVMQPTDKVVPITGF